MTDANPEDLNTIDFAVREHRSLWGLFAQT